MDWKQLLFHFDMFLLAYFAFLCILLKTQKGIFDFSQLASYRLICLFQQLICMLKLLPILFICNKLSLLFILLVRVPFLVKLSIWIIWKFIFFWTYFYTLIKILIPFFFYPEFILCRTCYRHQIAKDWGTW